MKTENIIQTEKATNQLEIKFKPTSNKEYSDKMKDYLEENSELLLELENKVLNKLKNKEEKLVIETTQEEV